MKHQKIYDDWSFLIIASLTLGLAPFYPEPHIVGKIRWIAGGANGMQWLDWFDFIWHGLPWTLLIRKILIEGKIRLTKDAVK